MAVKGEVLFGFDHGKAMLPLAFAVPACAFRLLNGLARVGWLRQWTPTITWIVTKSRMQPQWSARHVTPPCPTFDQLKIHWISYCFARVGLALSDAYWVASKPSEQFALRRPTSTMVLRNLGIPG